VYFSADGISRSGSAADIAARAVPSLSLSEIIQNCGAPATRRHAELFHPH